MNNIKKNNFLISVIIPAYNEEKYIEKCITSFYKQTIRNFEIIVIDDGSTDLTAKIALNMGVKLIKLSHGGSGRAKNKGAKVATGKILVFIDADMMLDKDYLKNIISSILKEQCIATYTTAEYVANKQNIWAICWNINSALPINRRIADIDKTRGLAFRAILRDRFIAAQGFDAKLGYIDDRSLSKRGVFAIPVSDAKCYHYNPETLKDVYFSARWIGRSVDFNTSLRNLFRYSIINSIKISFHKIINGAPIVFLVFKIFFDLGIITGILFKNSNRNYAK